MPEFKSEVVIDKNAFTEKGLNNFFNYADVLSFSRFNADDLLFEGIDNLDSEYISDEELCDMFGDADCVENMDFKQMRELYFFILGSSEFEKEQMMEHLHICLCLNVKRDLRRSLLHKNGYIPVQDIDLFMGIVNHHLCRKQGAKADYDTSHKEQPTYDCYQLYLIFYLL